MTHGFRAPLVRWLQEHGREAHRRSRRGTEEPRGVKAFAELYAALDATTKTNEKVAALTRYFSAARARRRGLGRRASSLAAGPSACSNRASWRSGPSRRPASPTGCSASATTRWATSPRPSRCCCLPPQTTTALPLHYWVEERLLPHARRGRRARGAPGWWRRGARWTSAQRFAWNKLLTGEFRVGVSASLVVRAIAEASGIAAEVIAHRLMGDWQPTAEFWRAIARAGDQGRRHQPAVSVLPRVPAGRRRRRARRPREWQVEWKWDGIRAQLIRRQWRTFLWSRGEELITDRFPELEALGALLPEGTVIDGEVLPWKDGAPLPFAQMQRRIGRKVLGPKILAEVPVVLVGYDLLEHAARTSASGRSNGGARS